MNGPPNSANPRARTHLHPSAGLDRRSIRWLLAGNALTLGLALWQGASVASLLWPFWFQSLVIGVFNFRRMRALRAFSTRGMSDGGGKRIPETEAGKRSTANFFLGHYGGFHVAYLLFLAALAWPQPHEWRWMLPAMLALVLVQARVHRDQVAADATARPSLTLMMLAPYLRVLPMHLILIVGAVLVPTGAMALMLTMVLKTLADLATHEIERRIHAGSGTPASGRT
jgi:hypothetical protein